MVWRISTAGVVLRPGTVVDNRPDALAAGGRALGPGGATRHGGWFPTAHEGTAGSEGATNCGEAKRPDDLLGRAHEGAIVGWVAAKGGDGPADCSARARGNGSGGAPPGRGCASYVQPGRRSWALCGGRKKRRRPVSSSAPTCVSACGGSAPIGRLTSHSHDDQSGPTRRYWDCRPSDDDPSPWPSTLRTW